MTIQVFGPGFGPNPCGCVASHGYPTYYPEWRVDTDMPGGGLDYARKKQGSGWIDLAVQSYKEDRYFADSSTGQQWRTNDKVVGWDHSLGIDPIGSGEDVTILKYHPGETDPLFNFNFAYDEFRNPPESIYNQDLVIWYRGIKTSNPLECVIGHPCKIESNWLPNGGW